MGFIGGVFVGMFIGTAVGILLAYLESLREWEKSSKLQNTRIKS
jgi:NhaP-type Na+/H+ or K+/H+ antiporter